MSEPAAEPTIEEAALAAAVAREAVADYSQQVDTGFVTRDELAAWITDEMGPKMQTLAQRLDELEAAVKQFRADLDQRIADSQKVAAEWADTFNRAEELRGQRDKELVERIERFEGEVGGQIERAASETLETLRSETDQKIAAALPPPSATAAPPEGSA